MNNDGGAGADDGSRLLQISDSTTAQPNGRMEWKSTDVNTIRCVSWDDEDGNHDGVEPVDTICALIRGLNGLSRSCVTIFDDPQTIGVGGGENGEVVVYRTEDDVMFYNLIGDHEADGTTELFVCGQPGEFPDRTLVSVEVAALAVRELLSGKPSSFVWEMDE